jgi:predicted Zn-dependent protease
MAWIHLKSGDTASALPVLSKLVSKYPDDPSFRYHYGAALLQTGDRAAAKQQLDIALTKKPSQALGDAIVDLLVQAR